VKAKLSLRERTYHCEGCGLVLDRDLNAAVNLARHALAEAERMGVIAPGGSGPLDSGRAGRKTTPPGVAGGSETATRTGAALLPRAGPPRRKARLPETSALTFAHQTSNGTVAGWPS
jgi:hypothetical protein